MWTQPLYICWWECKMVQLLWFLKKLEVEPPYDPAIPLLGTYPKEVKTCTQNKYMYAAVPSALFLTTNEYVRCGPSIHWTI